MLGEADDDFQSVFFELAGDSKAIHVNEIVVKTLSFISTSK